MPQQSSAVLDDEYGLEKAPKSAAGGVTDQEYGLEPAQKDTSTEQTLKNRSELPGATPRLQAATGGKALQPLTKFEKDRPGKGISLEGTAGEIWEGAKNLGSGALSLIDPTTGLSGAALAKLGILRSSPEHPEAGDVQKHLGEIPIVGAYREAKKGFERGHTPPGHEPLPGEQSTIAKTDEAIASGLGSLVGMSGERAAQSAGKGEGGEILGQAAVPLAATAAAEIAPRVIGPIGEGIKKAGITDEPAVAAQRALKPAAKYAEKAQRDITGGSPFLQGANNLKELQAKIPGAKAEVWHPYKEALERVGDNEVAAPKMKVDENGGLTARPAEETSISLNDLEKERLKASALLDKTRRLRPVDQQGILQKQGAEAQLNEHYQDILSRLDPELEAAGVDPKKVREVHGNIKGIEKLVAGKNTLTEADRSYGLGKLVKEASLKNPLRNLPLIGESVGEIAGGRPWWSGKPTDVAVKEGFNAGGEKPTLTRPVVQRPVAPQLPAPATEMPGPTDLGNMSREEMQGSRWVTPKAALPEVAPIQPQFLREIRPQPQQAPIKGLLPSGQAPETTIPPMVEESFGREETHPLPSSAEIAPERQLGTMGRGGVRNPIKGLLPNMSAEGERGWLLIRSILDTMESGDRPGRYFNAAEQNEPELVNLKEEPKRGIRHGGNWYGVKSMRTMLPWLKDHPEFTPEDLRHALRQSQKGRVTPVMRSAIEFAKREYENQRPSAPEEEEPPF